MRGRPRPRRLLFPVPCSLFPVPCSLFPGSYQTLPAPGVYDGDTTPTEAIIVVQLITPSKLATGACTFSTEAVMSTFTLAVIFTLPAASMVRVQPLPWLSVTVWAP